MCVRRQSLSIKIAGSLRVPSALAFNAQGDGNSKMTATIQSDYHWGFSGSGLLRPVPEKCNSPERRACRSSGCWFFDNRQCSGRSASRPAKFGIQIFSEHSPAAGKYCILRQTVWRIRGCYRNPSLPSVSMNSLACSAWHAEISACLFQPVLPVVSQSLRTMWWTVLSAVQRWMVPVGHATHRSPENPVRVVSALENCLKNQRKSPLRLPRQRPHQSR